MNKIFTLLSIAVFASMANAQPLPTRVTSPPHIVGASLFESGTTGTNFYGVDEYRADAEGSLTTTSGVMHSAGADENAVATYTPTLYSDSAGTILSAHIRLGADPRDSSEVIYSMTSRAANSDITHLLVFIDNGSMKGELDSTDTFLEMRSGDDIYTSQYSVKFSPGSAHILVVAGAKDPGVIETLYVRSPAGGSYSLLPVTIEKCEGYLQNGKAVIGWRVAENEMTREYIIERGADGVSFSPVGSVIAAKPTGRVSYEFLDSQALKAPVFYRIKFLPSQGHRIEYSKTILLKPQAAESRKLLLQNPVQNTLTITYTAERTAPHALSIYSMTGVRMFTTEILMRKNNNVCSLPLQPHLPRATYLLEVSDGKSRQVVKFVKL